MIPNPVLTKHLEKPKNQKVQEICFAVPRSSPSPTPPLLMFSWKQVKFKKKIKEPNLKSYTQLQEKIKETHKERIIHSSSPLTASYKINVDIWPMDAVYM